MSLKFIIPLIATALVATSILGTSGARAEPPSSEVMPRGAETPLEAIVSETDGERKAETASLAIPEPSRLLLLVLGLSLVGVAYRRGWKSFRESVERGAAS